MPIRMQWNDCIVMNISIAFCNNERGTVQMGYRI